MSGMQTDLSLRGQNACLGKENFSGSESLISDARRGIAEGCSSETPGVDMKLVIEHLRHLKSHDRSELGPCVEPERTLPLEEIFARIKIPSADSVRSIPEKELEDICKQNREWIGKAVEQLIDVIPRMGMSGLGEKALELLIENRRGTAGGSWNGHGGGVISWGIKFGFEINKEMLMGALDEMVKSAILYVQPDNRAEDPNPGCKFR